MTAVNPSVINDLSATNIKLIATDAANNPTMCTFTWSKTSFSLDGSDYLSTAGPMTYTLQMDSVGSNFSAPVTVLSTESLQADVMVEEMIAMLEESFGAQQDEQMDMEFRLLVNYGQKSSVYSKNIMRLSMTITLDQTVEPPVDYVETVYLIGAMNGWDNSNTDFMMFRPNSDYTTGIFTYTGRLAGDCYYKFINEDNLGSWNLYYTTTGTDVVLGQSDGGAWYNATEGYYTITLNLVEMTMSVTPFDITTAAPYAHATNPYPNADHTFNKVGVIGQFCGWDNEPALTQLAYDPHIWYLKAEYLSDVTYGIKFRAENNWDYKWSPDISTDVPYGVAPYKSATQDNNIDVTGMGAGTYFIKFNDLTGEYITKKID